MKYSFSFILLLSAFAGFSQSAKNRIIKPPTLFVHLSSFDFKTAPAIVQTSLGHVLSNGGFSSLKENYNGLGIGYQQGLTPKIDIAAALNGVNMFYGFRNKPGYGTRNLLLEGDLALNFKLLTDQHTIVPYLTAGLGMYRYRKTYGGYAPLGLGLQANVANKFYVSAAFQYRAPVTSEAQYHFMYSLSAGIPLRKIKWKKHSAAPLAQNNTPPIDTDGDGTPDATDNCPGESGPASNQGCPLPPADRDNDGVPDSLDKCPDTPGLPGQNGCPLPDADKDGIPDILDKCPNDSGIAKYDGCPDPFSDKDGDGVPDKTDKCPDVPGPASNLGCPVKKDNPTGGLPKKNGTAVLASYEVFFFTGQTFLPDASYDILLAVVDLMDKNPGVKIQATGFADNMEFGANPVSGSFKRAATVSDFLINRGISKSRITVTGAGTARPKASNSTQIGRSLNRRVEIKITGG